MDRVLSGWVSHAAWVFLGSLLAGGFWPDAAHALHGALPVLLMLALAIATARLETRSLGQALEHPLRLLLVVLWLLVLSPMLVLAVLSVLPVATEFVVALFLFAAVSPMTSAPSIAAAFRFQADYVVVGLLASSVLMPVFLPLLAGFAFDAPIGLSAGPLAVRLAAIILPALLLGAALRGLRARHATAVTDLRLDAAAVLTVAGICLAVMDGVGPAVAAQPGLAVSAFGLTLAVGLVLAGVAALAFRPIAPGSAPAVALMSGLRNVGVPLAALGPAATLEFTLVVAAAQWIVLALPLVRRLAYPRGAASGERLPP